MDQSIIQGITAVLPTPFDVEGNIDFEGLGALVESVVDGGVHALMAGGPLGECHVQSTEERRQVLAFLAERVTGRRPIFAGTASVRPRETVELSNYAKTLGYSAIVLEPPPHAFPDRAALIGHFHRLAADTSIPIVLSNDPARTGVDLDQSLLEGLADIAAIQAFKESSGAFGRYLSGAAGEHPGPERICGSDHLALDYFLWGSVGWFSGVASFLPTEAVSLYQACALRGDWPYAKQIMSALMPITQLIETSGKQVAYVKYGCQVAGISVGEARAPLHGLSEAERERFRKLYEQLKTNTFGRLAA